MIKRKRIKKFLSEQFEGIRNRLSEMEGHVDKEKLHDLRLHSKKAKAVILFLQDTLQSKKRYSIKKMKELFHHAGDIRTAQLNLETIKEHGIESEVLESDQRRQMDNNIEELAQNITRYRRQVRWLTKRVGGNLRSVKNKRAISFYYTNIKQLSTNFARVDENNLHDSRKIIKTLLYNQKILPGSLAKKININKEYLDDLQELIGKWHDLAVLLELLSRNGTLDETKLAPLLKNRQALWDKVIEETRDFDSRVIFAKQPGA